MSRDAASVPQLDERCRLTVVIPAKNEETLLSEALAALIRQRALDGKRLDPRTFDVLVYCNDCDDATAAVARRFAARRRDVAIAVLDERMPAHAAHIGTARRAALDIAVQRFIAAGRPHGVVASTDADTIVGSTWIARTLDEMRHVDAVAGFVSVSPAERDRMFAPLRLLYDRELAYRHLIGCVEARFDPRPHDPGPRHDAFVGASFAVTAGAYCNAGGLTPLPRLEDQAFARALERIDARVRHSYDVRAYTSSRSIARVDGGFATFLLDLGRVDGQNGYLVRPARAVIEGARTRALLRELWNGARDRDGIEALAHFVELDAGDITAAAGNARTFGELWFELESCTRQARYPDEPVESAIRAMRRALAASIPVDPTRESVASGAG